MYIGNVAGIAKVRIVSITLLNISSVSLAGANIKKAKPSNINKNLSTLIFFINILIFLYSSM